MYARLVCTALLGLALVACTKGQPAQNAATNTPVEPCPLVYTYAPGNYIVDVASGSEVLLDPGVQEFDLFCSPGDARAAVNEAVRLGILTEGDWRIYRVEGSMEEIGQRQGKNQHTLARMTQIVDWVAEKP
jgi:hypothetical protein